MADQEKEVSQEVDHLIALVDRFNEEFKKWSSDYGMVVKFGWNYGGENFPKELKILGVDKIIYRQKPPNWRSLAERVDGGDGEPQ